MAVSWRLADLPALAALAAAALGCLALDASCPIHARAVEGLASQTQAPFYLSRGNAVEARYKDYTVRLKRCYDQLLARTKAGFPRLFAKLRAAPPRPARHGYQLLPEIRGDAPPTPQSRPRAISTSYSWTRTDRMIDDELVKIGNIERDLAQARTERQLEPIVDFYELIEPNERLLDSHVQYNRFWQEQVFRDRSRFDRLTRLHDKVLARQKILDALAEEGAGAPRKIASQVEDAQSPPERMRKVASLREKERQLAREIHVESEGLNPPSFLKVLRAPHRILVRVPLYTDIRDDGYLARVRSVIESKWEVRDGRDSFRIEVQLRKIDARSIYTGGSSPPKDGEEFDIAAHVARFPTDGAVLTTGAITTYAMPGRYVALGSADTEANVLAHEFGHILGFTDGYFRGYHDLGPDGFEILEVIPDPQDIMSTPGAGRVQRFHYERLLGKLKA